MVCNECGGMIGYFYKNKNTIVKIKEKTKDWECVNGVNVCGECLIKMRN